MAVRDVQSVFVVPGRRGIGIGIGIGRQSWKDLRRRRQPRDQEAHGELER
jgi:hypothetical protein